ncbi:3-oxoacyl-ACP synthase III family protein [Kitasatospora griseola]|uniref:3-oxoacyl-ACP synthase III family protein n=1 Tax=Kitasatospora griseola TaxID=2064 RepID=UPI0034134AAF
MPRLTAPPQAPVGGYGILGTGSYLPPVVVPNGPVAAAAGVTDEWIVRKTGIRERRHARPDQAASDLAAHAATAALATAGIDPGAVGLVLVATSTPDHPQPATANLVQHLIGADRAAAFDLNAVCSGFVYALEVARTLLPGLGPTPYALVIGVDVYSRILDPTDRRTAVLFGDGAGAVLLGPTPDGPGLHPAILRSVGAEHRLIGVQAGGSRLPASARTVADGSHHFRMDGRAVRAFVAEELPALVHDTLAAHGLPAPDLDHFIPHQANGVMLDELAPRLGLRPDTLRRTVTHYGNTGAASIPLTLDATFRAGLLAPGHHLLLAAFGGGMNLAATLCTWTGPRPGPAVDRPVANGRPEKGNCQDSAPATGTPRPSTASASTP